MGYELNALIGKTTVLSQLKVASANPVLVPLIEELSLLPVPKLPNFLAIYGDNHIEIGSGTLPATLHSAVVSASGLDMIAHINAELFGGIGYQSATIWQDKEIYMEFPQTWTKDVTSWSEMPINKTLREFGIIAGETDEFSIAGLGRFRNTEQWYASV